jgi:signal transduction histidine kinase
VFPFDEDPEPDSLMRAYAQLLTRVVNGKSAATAVPDGTAQVEAWRQRVAQRLRELVHEANNPLSIVNNYLHILELRLSDDSSIREQLGTMSRELKRAASIVQQMKDLPPADEQQPAESHPAPLPCDIALLIRRIVELHRGYADAASVEIDLLPVPATLKLVTDENLLSQVLVNLLRNAIEACRSGDLVTVGLQESVYRDGIPGVEIEVHDSGPGIEPAVLSRLFEPKTSTKGPEHSGLGLSIVHRLVGTLGGSIDVRTSAAGGTSFRIFLPETTTALT